MITAFAGYLLVVSAVCAGAAWTIEQALSVRQWPRRLVWLVGLAGCGLGPGARTIPLS